MYFEVFKLSSQKQVQVAKNSVEGLQDAKLYWYRQIQWEVYQAEYQRLEENILLPNTSAILKLYSSYDKRDRLLKVGGRLQNSDLPEGT